MPNNQRVINGSWHNCRVPAGTRL